MRGREIYWVSRCAVTTPVDAVDGEYAPGSITVKGLLLMDVQATELFGKHALTSVWTDLPGEECVAAISSFTLI